ncbi:MAG: protein-methionine-sulfoxide reductase heme-binding subunit MsrQ [Pseudomonadota bacterium]
MPSKLQLRSLKAGAFLLCLWPAANLTWALFNNKLGANPVEELLRENGIWALNFLLITLAVTPVRRLTGLTWLVRFRRMLGLFAFFYALLHFAIYVSLDLQFDFPNLAEDIIERPYITIGFAAVLLLFPLAITSTNSMMRRLGRRWLTLHTLIYPIAILGVWHYWWLVKKDITEPVIYALVLCLLLGSRLFHRVRRFAKTA